MPQTERIKTRPKDGSPTSKRRAEISLTRGHSGTILRALVVSHQMSELVEGIIK